MNIVTTSFCLLAKALESRREHLTSRTTLSKVISDLFQQHQQTWSAYCVGWVWPWSNQHLCWSCHLKRTHESLGTATAEATAYKTLLYWGCGLCKDQEDQRIFLLLCLVASQLAASTPPAPSSLMMIYRKILQAVALLPELMSVVLKTVKATFLLLTLIRFFCFSW